MKRYNTTIHFHDYKTEVHILSRKKYNSFVRWFYLGEDHEVFATGINCRRDEVAAFQAYEINNWVLTITLNSGKELDFPLNDTQKVKLVEQYATPLTDPKYESELRLVEHIDGIDLRIPRNIIKKIRATEREVI